MNFFFEYEHLVFFGRQKKYLLSTRNTNSVQRRSAHCASGPGEPWHPMTNRLRSITWGLDLQINQILNLNLNAFHQYQKLVIIYVYMYLYNVYDKTSKIKTSISFILVICVPDILDAVGKSIFILSWERGDDSWAW